jgi:hypothetical protein
MQDIHITAASAPLMLDEDEYQASPLTDKDLAELTTWIQTKIVQTAINSLPVATSQTLALREEILSIAVKASAAVSWQSLDGIKILETPDGMARITWQMTRKNHSGLEHSNFIKYFKDPTNAQNFFLIFQKLHPTLTKPMEGATGATEKKG